MASKEATVYIIDQGATTAASRNGRDESDLDYLMRYVWGKLADVMAANRTTLSVGVVGFRTNETNNEESGDDYENINVLKPLGPLEMQHLRTLQRTVKPSQTESGDAISAIIVAMQMIQRFTTLKTGKPGKYKRKIVLVTDGRGFIDDDAEALDQIAEKINENEIELVVM